MTSGGPVSDQRKLLSKKILIIAALLSGIASAAYACTFGSGVSALRYSFCMRLSSIGLPGILFAAACSIAALGSHGGGPLGMLLVIATPINFLLYIGLGVAGRVLLTMFRKRDGKST